MSSSSANAFVVRTVYSHGSVRNMKLYGHALSDQELAKMTGGDEMTPLYDLLDEATEKRDG